MHVPARCTLDCASACCREGTEDLPLECARWQLELKSPQPVKASQPTLGQEKPLKRTLLPFTACAILCDDGLLLDLCC